MKQSHTMRCEVVTIKMGCWSAKTTADRIRETVQERLCLGWTLRAAPTEGDEYIHLIFVRKEAK